jgi:hypothetical protein
MAEEQKERDVVERIRFAVARLEQRDAVWVTDPDGYTVDVDQLLTEAADEIERLRKKVVAATDCWKAADRHIEALEKEIRELEGKV